MTVRTVGAGQQADYNTSVSAEAYIWRITRTDGVSLYFTSHDQDITFGGNVYESAVGFTQSNLSNDSNLTVDNSEARGLFDSTKISEIELRGGRYDYAYVEMALVDWKSPDASGETIIRAGWIGEVIFDERSGIFTTELRGLSQAYQQKIIESYGRPCRYTLGDSRCNRDGNLTITAPNIQNNTTYAVGDVVRVRASADDVVVLHAPGVVDDDDDSQYGATGTTGSDATAADTTKLKNLAGNFRFTPAAGPTSDPSNSFASWADATQYTIGLEAFTIELWFNADAIDLDTAQSGPILASKYDATGNQREWFLGIIDSQTAAPGLTFSMYDGTTRIGTINLPLAEFKPVRNNWHHIAVVRDETYKVTLYVDGKARVSEYMPVSPVDGTAPVRLGMFSSAPGGNRHFEGSIEDFRFLVGDAAYRSDFTPPGALSSTFADSFDTTGDFADTLYVVTVAGTTHASAPFIFHSSEGPDADTGTTALSVSANNTFARAAGSFVDDGFVPDMVIRTTGFTNGANNSDFRVSSVSATTLVVTATSLVVEGAGSDERIVQVNVTNGVEFSATPSRLVSGTVTEVFSNSVIRLTEGDGGLLSVPITFANFGFETGSLGPWTLTGGSVTIVSGGAHSGTYSLRIPTNWTGSNFATIEQTVSVADYAASIDAGSQTITTNWWYKGNSGAAGQIRINYTFNDSGGSPISSTVGTFKEDPSDTWVQMSQTNTIPVGTRTIDVEVEGGNGTEEPLVDDFTITTTLADATFPDDEFRYGTLTFETGLNAGLSVEIKDYDSLGKIFTLFLSANFDITVGDKVSVSIGCNREAERCKELDNIINYGGFRFIPGDDAYFSYPDSPY